MALAVLYVVSPLDVLPDVLPLIGVADDAMVVVWLAGAVLSETGDFLAWDRAGSTAGKRTGAGSSPSGRGRPDVVSGRVVR
jgi:uncharacterized membrane protein YkvA (DUF1232 family)